MGTVQHRRERRRANSFERHLEGKEHWYPNANVVIPDKLLEDIGQSGIVVSGCDGGPVGE
jgi:hypothetical protein